VSQLASKILSKHPGNNYKAFSYLSTEQLFALYSLMAPRMTTNVEILDQDIFQVLSEDQFSALDSTKYISLVAQLGDTQKVKILQGMQPDHLFRSIGENRALTEKLCDFRDKEIYQDLCAALHVKDITNPMVLSDSLRNALNSGNTRLAKALSIIHGDQRVYGIALNQLINDSRLQSAELFLALSQFFIKPENFGNIQAKLQHFSDAEQLQILRNIQRHSSEKDFTLWISNVSQSTKSKSVKFFSLTYTNKSHKETQ
jgi:hypothetical protein